MAKGTTGRSGSSKVRFVMLEADIAEGDLTPVLHAIQNALKQPQSPQRVLQARLSSPPDGDGLQIEPIEDVLVDEEGETPTTPARTPRPPAKRVYRTPDVIDVDLDSNLSFEEFANSKSPSSTFDRYLIVAAWFKLHRKVDAITADHVYTCFRKIGWSVNIKDFTKPLQNLKSAKLFGGDATAGFAINHLGLDRVDKMSKQSA